MPSRKRKQAASSGSGQGDRRQTRSVTTKVTSADSTSTCTPPTKKRKVKDPLTKDDIPSIVKALPGTSGSRRTDTTDAAPLDSSSQGQSSAVLQSTPPHPSHFATGQRDSSAALTAHVHSTMQQRETGNDEPPHIDSGE